MIPNDLYQKYVQILKEELVPAMGCTESVAIAYAGARAAKLLKDAGEKPVSARVEASGDILKNVKSALVPNTGGLRGIENALAAGIAVGNADAGADVLLNVTEKEYPKIGLLQLVCPITVVCSDSDEIFEIKVVLASKNHVSVVHILDEQTNVVLECLDDTIVYQNEKRSRLEKTDRSCLTVDEIVEFADVVEIADVKEVLDRQIEYNMAIAEEGINHKYGASVGRIFLNAYPDDVKIRAKAYAAAGSDARINGCRLPVIVNSGSTNQGLTVSVPVVVFAREFGILQEKLYRALCVSNLITVHLQEGIGTRSGYCGVVSAGAAAGAGVTYLLGGGFKDVAHTLVNALAIDSGIICDGAKASCAAKIAISVESGLLGMDIYKNESRLSDGEISVQVLERTIEKAAQTVRENPRSVEFSKSGLTGKNC